MLLQPGQTIGGAPNPTPPSPTVGNLNPTDFIKQARAQGVPDADTFQYLQKRGAVPDTAVVPANSQPEEKGALFTAKPGQESTTATVSKTVGNVVPDFLKTTFWDLPVGVAKQVFSAIPKEFEGLVHDQPQNILTPEAIHRASLKGEVPQDYSSPVMGAIKNYLQVLISPTPDDTAQIAKGMIKALVPSAAQSLAQAGVKYLKNPNDPEIDTLLHSATSDIANHPFQQIAPFLMLADEGIKKAGGPDIIEKAASPVTKTVGKAAEVVGTLAKEHIVEPMQERAIVKTSKAFEDLAAGSNKAYKTLTRAEEMGQDPARFLSENNVIPQVEEGKVRAQTALHTLDEMAAPLNEHLDTALREVAPGVKVPDFASFRDEVLQGVNQIKNISEVTREQIAKHISDELMLQEKKLGPQPTLTDYQDMKKSSWASTKFDSTKPYLSDSNYQIGRVAKQIIERSVPEDAFNVKELNGHLGDIYGAKKFLQSLEGKAVRGGRLGNYFGEVVGGMVGSSLPLPFGTGTLAGAYAGDYIARLMQSTRISNPLRQYLLKNIAEYNPEAYKKMVDYIDKAQTARAARLQLPAPQSIILPEYKGGPTKWLTQEEAQARLKELGVKGAGPFTKIEITDESGKKQNIPIRKPLNLRKSDSTINLRPKQEPVKVKVTGD